VGVTEATGGCLCGSVSYRIRGELRDVVFCHCSRCRRTHGHVAAYTACPRADLEVEDGGTLRWFAQDGRRRGFCAGCGASLFWERDGSETVSVAAGTLDEPTGLRPRSHIFTASAGDYYEIADGLERFPEGGG
jgi:hypothetical protein